MISPGPASLTIESKEEGAGIGANLSTESNVGNGQLAGKCGCGAVRYRVADEFLYAANCHCSRCHAATGSAFKPFAGIEREKLEITDGLDRLLVFGEEDSNDTRRAVCGSLLFSVVREGAYVHVALGRSSTLPPFGPAGTSSSAPRHPGSRSPTTCRNSRSSTERKECEMTVPLKSVGAITLFVQDPQRSKSFYERVFDLPAAHEYEDAAGFRPGLRRSQARAEFPGRNRQLHQGSRIDPSH
jgi:hypothetical protein